MTYIKIPKVNRMQFGVIDQNFVNRATQMANEFSVMKPRLNSLLARVNTFKYAPPIFARILSSEPYLEIRIKLAGDPNNPVDVEVAWTYKWEQVQVRSVDTMIPKFSDPPQGGHHTVTTMTSDIIEELYGEKQGLAYNVAEMANPQTAGDITDIEREGTIFGINMEVGTYPAGFRPMPVPDNAYVQLTAQVAIEDNYMFYTFDRQGVHDGACEAVSTYEIPESR